MYLGVFELAKQTTHLRRETIIEILNEVEYSVGWGVAIQCQGYNNCILLAVNRSIQYWKKDSKNWVVATTYIPFFSNEQTYVPWSVRMAFFFVNEKMKREVPGTRLS